MNCAIHTEIPATAYCRTCGKALCENCKRDVMGVIYCESCLAAHLHGTLPTASPGMTNPTGAGMLIPRSDAPNPVLAGLLGMIPGVGAMYNGQFVKGFVNVVVFALLIYGADHAGPLEVFFGLGIAAWWFYMVIDAYRTAKAKEYGLPPPDPLGINSLFAAPTETIPQQTTATPATPPPTPSFVAPSQPLASDHGRNTPTGAIVLIGLGVLFLLNNMGIFHFYMARMFWPLFLIGLGIWLFYRRTMPR